LALQTHLQLASENHRLFDDVEGLFADARQAGVPLALITNGASDTQRDKLNVLGIEPRFAAVVVSAEVGMAKPDPAIFDFALAELGVGRDNAWHVGDSLKADVAGAKAAGLGAVWLNRTGAIRGESQPEPDLEVSSLSGLLAMIAQP
jgi:putative hydrolase of the HAD superfamily